MSRIRSNNSKPINSNYQSLYLWISFLIGLITFLSQTKVQALTINLEQLSSQEGFTLKGGSNTGYDVYAADINDDKNMDLLIGAYGANKAYLVYGSNFQNLTDLDALNEKQGAIFVGAFQTGYSVFAADINDDKKIDILLGGSSKVYVLYGPNFTSILNLDNLNATQGFIFAGNSATTISRVFEDINNDQKKDLLFGAYTLGKIYLVYGPNFLNATNLNSLSVNQGVIFSGGSGTGTHVFAADVNNDKKMDLLTGAYNANRAYVVYGPDFATSTNLDNLNATQGVIFTGSMYTGYNIFAADVNNDSYSDILLGAHGVSTAYVVYGPNFSNSKNLGSMNNKQGAIFTGGAYTGLPVYAWDMNGDGVKDLLIGAYSAGKVYLVYGPDFSNINNLENLNNTQGVIFKGLSGTGLDLIAADINGDNKLDMVIGAFSSNKVYVVFNEVFNLFPATISKTLTILPTITSSSSIISTSKDSMSTSPQLATTEISKISQVSITSSTTIVTTELSTTSKLLERKSSVSNNTALYAGIGGAVGGVTLLLGGIGLFACYQKRKNKQLPSQNNAVPLRDESIRSQPQSNIYTAAPLMSGEGNSERPSMMRPDYLKIDETKKTEKEYDRMPKLEI